MGMVAMLVSVVALTTGTQESADCNQGSYIVGIRYLRTQVWKYQDRLEVSKVKHSSLKGHSCNYLDWAHKLWKQRLVKVRADFRLWFSRAYAKWSCIHRHEASWTDPNAPYYGGLQMDIQFMRSHGSDFLRIFGTADKWPVWAQLRVAERAYKTRGFYPWPNTARYCGLL